MIPNDRNHERELSEKEIAILTAFRTTKVQGEREEAVPMFIPKGRARRN